MIDRVRGAAVVIVVGRRECRFGQGHLGNHVTRPVRPV
jgi:hypothetical protein